MILKLYKCYLKLGIECTTIFSTSYFAICSYSDSKKRSNDVSMFREWSVSLLILNGI